MYVGRKGSIDRARNKDRDWDNTPIYMYTHAKCINVEVLTGMLSYEFAHMFHIHMTPVFHVCGCV